MQKPKDLCQSPITEIANEDALITGNPFQTSQGDICSSSVYRDQRQKLESYLIEEIIRSDMSYSHLYIPKMEHSPWYTVDAR